MVIPLCGEKGQYTYMHTEVNNNNNNLIHVCLHANLTAQGAS
jgi:hypothetical protein